MPKRTDMLIAGLAVLGACSAPAAPTQADNQTSLGAGPTPEQVMNASKDCGIRNAEAYHVGEESNGLRLTSGKLSESERDCLRAWQKKHDMRFEVDAKTN